MAVRMLGTLALSGGLSLIGIGATGTTTSTATTVAVHARRTVRTRVTAAWPITSIAAGSNGKGYLVAAEDGGIFNFGGAAFEGNTYTDGLTGLSGAHPLNAPIVGMAAEPAGTGYWLVAKDGGVFNFGGAKFAGSTYSYGITGLSGAHPLNAPIVGIIPTPNGGGYWLIAADGGVFDFGNAKFYGSTYSQGHTGLGGSNPISGRIVGGVATPSGNGYWLVSSTGAVYNFGGAANEGDAASKGYTGLGGSHPLPAPIVSIAADSAGTGYWLVGSDGSVYNFGSAVYSGDVPSLPTPGKSSAGGGGQNNTTVATTQAPNVTTTHQNPPPPSSLLNPTTNISANPNYYSSCTNAVDGGQSANSVACEQSAVAAINTGRADQGLPAMSLPNNFYQLPAIDQLFVLVNEERVSRGLVPVYGLS
ncbi:hypothetical protein, partial [Ferrimicrobium acidiphilum]|uniref:hypothetical protein n=1 Tax=Ferrimicrobium acidiphilum TaxID=121039 RepID=UPI0023F04523